MSCRAQAVRDVQALGHLPTFSPPDLPDGYAECLVCRDWITAEGLFQGQCPGPTGAVPVASAIEPLNRPGYEDDEHIRTVAMVARCAQHQR